MIELLLVVCGIFYAILCVFSIVTGLMYATGRRELNPIELPDSFVSRLSEDADALRRFAVRMGWVTFVVGIAQGVTAWGILTRGGLVAYAVAIGFTLFSLASVSVKLRGKVGAFPVMKCVAYVGILVVLLLPVTRILFLS